MKSTYQTLGEFHLQKFSFNLFAIDIFSIKQYMNGLRNLKYCRDNRQWLELNATTANLKSCPPSLLLLRGKEGMIHLLVETHVKKPDFLSDWSRNNKYESMCSDWLLYFNETSGRSWLV